jgi:hypothetical protein
LLNTTLISTTIYPFTFSVYILNSLLIKNVQLLKFTHFSTLERLRYPGSVLRVRVSPFCLPIFADVSIFTRNFYPFPRCKPWSTRKRQTCTGVFCLLFVGRLNSKNFQHLTQINHALISESCHSLIGLLSPKYLGFLKLKVVPRFTGTCISPVPVNRNRGILTSLFSLVIALSPSLLLTSLPYSSSAFSRTSRHSLLVVYTGCRQRRVHHTNLIKRF